MTFKSHSFLFFSSQQIHFFVYISFHLNIIFLNHQHSLLIPHLFLLFFHLFFFSYLRSLSKNDATRTKRFSRLYCRLANKSLKLLFSRSFHILFFHTIIFSQPKENEHVYILLRKIFLFSIYLREFTHTFMNLCSFFS